MQKISEWAYKWKMSFNPNLNKWAQEDIFSWKSPNHKSSHPKILFNNTPVFCANWQKYLGMYLNKTLNCNLHMSKVLKGIGIIKKLSKSLPKHSLVTTYKSIVRPHLDYGDITSDLLKFHSENWKNSIQCCPCNYRCHQKNISEQVVQQIKFWISEI